MTLSVVAAAGLLLALPGPTNALVAAATATSGHRRLLPAIATVVLAYALSLTLLGLFAATAATLAPVATRLFKLTAAIVLAGSALRLWRATASTQVPLTCGRIFLVTLINPKALVLAFAILPVGVPPTPALAVALAATIAASTALWGGIGLVLGRFGRRHAGTGALNKATAAVLAAFAGAVMVSAAVTPL